MDFMNSESTHSVRRPMVAGNWKMNGSRSESKQLVDGIVRDLSSHLDLDIVVCPPFILVAQVADQLRQESRIKCGAQNLDNHESGAYTGEISASMLVDCGCDYVIVGHSERRTLFGETDSLVANKIEVAQQHALIPILCVGETLDEREAVQTEIVVGRQLDVVIDRVGIARFSSLVLAYEPVWAIGTGKTATPEQAQAVHGFLRNRLAQQDDQIAAGLRILYGGSVKADNAKTLFGQADIDGGLIGGASLDAQEFVKICRATT